MIDFKKFDYEFDLNGFIVLKNLISRSKVKRLNNILQKIENFEIINRHFIPQYLWLLHLHKHFKGIIEFKPVSELYNLIPNRNGPWSNNATPWKAITQEEKDKILSIKHKKYIEIDEKIIKKYMNESVELKKIIREFKI